MKKRTAITLIMFAIIPILGAQDHKVKVWPDSPPGAIDNPEYSEQLVRRNDNLARIKKVTEPTLEVFLPPAEKANGTAVVICPGGGYSILAIGHEGYDIARWLNKNGIAGIVLKHRLPSDEIMEDRSIGPLQDAQEAIRIVRRNSGKWNIRAGRIGIMGFSAGGHLASTASTHFNDNVYQSDGTSARPDFSLLIYPVISFDTAICHRGSRNRLLGLHPAETEVVRFSNEKQVNAETPPAFLVHSFDDKAVNPENSIRYAQALKKYNVPAELHLYEGGGHGYGLGRSRSTENAWPDACINWLKIRGLLD